jgi:hypothetical protein
MQASEVMSMASIFNSGRFKAEDFHECRRKIAQAEELFFIEPQKKI